MMLEFECINDKKLENYEKIYPASFKLLSRFSSWWILGKSLLWNGISVVVRQRCELDKYKFTQILANWVPNKNHKFLEASGSMTAVWQDLGNCSLLLCAVLSACVYLTLLIRLGRESSTLYHTPLLLVSSLSFPLQHRKLFAFVRRKQQNRPMCSFAGHADLIWKGFFQHVVWGSLRVSIHRSPWSSNSWW